MLNKAGMIITMAIAFLAEPTNTQRKIRKLCDLCGRCEIIRKCLQLRQFLMTEIRTNPNKSNVHMHSISAAGKQIAQRVEMLDPALNPFQGPHTTDN